MRLFSIPETEMAVMTAEQQQDWWGSSQDNELCQNSLNGFSTQLSNTPWPNALVSATAFSDS
jgi:hypothetical protein